MIYSAIYQFVYNLTDSISNKVSVTECSLSSLRLYVSSLLVKSSSFTILPSNFPIPQLCLKIKLNLLVSQFYRATFLSRNFVSKQKETISDL